MFGLQSGICGSQLSGIVLLPGVSGGFDVSAVAVVFDVFGFVAGAGGVHEDVQSLAGDADFLVGPLFADAVDDLSGEGVGDLPVVQAVVEVPAGEAVAEHEAVAVACPGLHVREGVPGAGVGAGCRGAVWLYGAFAV